MNLLSQESQGWAGGMGAGANFRLTVLLTCPLWIEIEFPWGPGPGAFILGRRLYSLTRENSPPCTEGSQHFQPCIGLGKRLPPDRRQCPYGRGQIPPAPHLSLMGSRLLVEGVSPALQRASCL